MTHNNQFKTEKLSDVIERNNQLGTKRVKLTLWNKSIILGLKNKYKKFDFKININIIFSYSPVYLK